MRSITRLAAARAIAAAKGRADLVVECTDKLRAIRYATPGELGPNGFGPGIDDLCDRCATGPTMNEMRRAYRDTMPGVTALNQRLAFPHLRKDAA